ncbi:secreted protein [Streptomyces hygroscopicus subsp. jinggangensis 5008]|nr:secreted protein [Streptomyces hygroscopicus subsp. jinggangensis 5008]AGF66540.1 secreted protein [Streptomyces hygroscopicus subsp. jinggangensis TL01]
MFRGTTVRTLLTLLGVTLLAFQFFTPTGSFAPAHTFGQVLAKAETGTIPSALPVREGAADKVRAPGCPGDPAGIPHVRDRQRGPASGCAQERAFISGRMAETGPSEPSGGPHHPTPRASRTHTPAALQVFRC